MRLCLIAFHETKGYVLLVQVKRKCLDFAVHAEWSAPDCLFCDHILFTGFLPTVITRNFALPRQVGRKELTGSIQYKFAQNLPVAPEDIWWEYRILNAKEKDADYRVRAASVDKDEFKKHMMLLRQNNAEIDQCILTPLLLEEELFPGISQYGPPLLENFAGYVHEKKAAEYENFIKSLKTELPESVSLSFFALVCFIEKYGKTDSIIPCSGMVPDDIRPVRYRSLRRLTLALAILTMIFAAALLVERGKHSYVHYQKIEQENDALRKQLRGLQAENFRLTAKEKMLNEYRDLKAGYAELENLLLEITQKIPSYMWVKSFRLSGNSVEMMVESSKDDINFYNTMKRGALYELKNLRKNKGRGDGFDYSVTLELVQP